MAQDHGEIEPVMPYAVKKGVLVGIISCILVTLIYIVDYKLLAFFTTAMTLLAVSVILVGYFCIDYRKRNTGYLSFGKAFILAMIIYLSGHVIGQTFNMTLYYLIDPELPELLTEAVLANWEGNFRSFGMPQEEIDRQLAILEKDIPQQFTIMGVIKNSWILIVMTSVLAAINAGIAMKREPIYKS